MADQQYLQLEGQLELRIFYENTKNQLFGLYLVAADTSYLIRPADSPPDIDNPFLPYAGNYITATGYVEDDVFLATYWSIREDND
ncbi:hypothetical protein KTO58_16080 [Chitinophaga pendula]|uniref:hypothetical protein n=1 Tax=Chitinophaga TaxID=79328 RepID=UPI000BB05D6E|nr:MULTISPECIES: hypothetical protein [Chitinophaga]ASZ11770.1 hypothetical protein CK934_12770 [Chitinophaga sp. MD30]UCJ05211.1 hypothetical protein KTO58_16080 [Chitinophaga pendula]